MVQATGKYLQLSMYRSNPSLSRKGSTGAILLSYNSQQCYMELYRLDYCRVIIGLCNYYNYISIDKYQTYDHWFIWYYSLDNFLFQMHIYKASHIWTLTEGKTLLEESSSTSSSLTSSEDNMSSSFREFSKILNFTREWPSALDSSPSYEIV